jgi:hypothetical protein
MGDMPGTQVELVALFTCKKCGVRMFWQDCRGHMDRHGIATNGDLNKHFRRGLKDTPPRPGSDFRPFHAGHIGKNASS